MTLGDAGALYGASRASVHIRCKREGWVKRLSPAEMNRMALDRANALATATVAQATLSEARRLPPPTAAVIERRPQKHGAPDVITTHELREEVETAAIEERAEVLLKHRKEWSLVRMKIYKAARESDHRLAQLAKLIAESIRVMQESERKCYGLDYGGDPSEVRIVIERTGATA